ncbi:MAG: carboxymuconolactone decarboxylase family protein [Chloroflexi bacterium]|nr:carboxymuconolactone decarboxylase family protein [Chloroflexota bacterium]
MARISYLEKDQAPAEVQDLYQRLESGGAKVLNLYKVLAHDPAAMRAFMRLGNRLLTSTKLPPKLRELAILRVAQLTDSRYEWGQHVPIALEAGVQQEQVDSLVYWPRSKAFDDVERAVLAYTGEMTERVRVADDTFAALRHHLDEPAVLDLTLCVGYWGMVARVLVALKVDLEAPSASLRGITGR